MQYEDLRTATQLHYEHIGVVEGERDQLKMDLEEMTRFRDILDEKLK